MKSLLRCKIIVDEPQIEILWGILALHISFGWEEESLPTGQTLITVHNECKDFIDELCKSVQENIPQFFTPINCGKHFIVLPPWLQDNTDLQDRTPIVIEPKSAFGTGHHNTTALCLGVISSLIEQQHIKSGMEFLDIGTGSGILSLGCALSGLYGMGVDIEIQSIENAKENIILNKIPPHDRQLKQGIELGLGSVELVKGRSFDLVLANILASPLKDLAKDIVPLVKTGSYLVLSGILNIQAQDVEKAYMAQGLPKATIVNDGDWVALVWKNIIS